MTEKQKEYLELLREKLPLNDLFQETTRLLNNWKTVSIQDADQQIKKLKACIFPSPKRRKRYLHTGNPIYDIDPFGFSIWDGFMDFDHH